MNQRLNCTGRADNVVRAAGDAFGETDGRWGSQRAKRHIEPEDAK